MPVSARRLAWLPGACAWLLGSLICLSATLYNGFPLVTSDTGSYLNSALSLAVPNDRPATYGLFMRVSGLHFSYWLIVWAQSLLLAGLLLRCVVVFAPRIRGWAGRLALLGAVAWGTGFAWYCGQLMPDIFTAIGLLALGLLVLGGFGSRAGQAGLLAVLLLSTIMHNSNLVSFSLAALGFGAVAWQQRLFGRGLVRRAHWLAATAVVLAGWLVLPTLHAALGGGFTLSRAAPVFLMGRLVEAGIIDRYLDDHCGDPDATWLCTYRNNLPHDAISFVWSDESPYNKTGGLTANVDSYRRIERQILASPRYYPSLLALGLQSTLRQATHFAHGDGLGPYRENSSPYWKIPELIPFELKPYLASLQNQGNLHFDDLNTRSYAAQLLALAVAVLAAGAARRGRLGARATPAFLLLMLWGLGLLANAFAVGALANVLDRLQGRVAWLLPLGAALLLTQWLPDWRRWLPARPGAPKGAPATGSTLGTEADLPTNFA